MYGNADDTATTTTSIHFSVASSGDLAAVADGAGVGGRGGRDGDGGGGGGGGRRGAGENSLISRSELPSSPNLQSRTNVHVASPTAAAAGAGSHAPLPAPKPTRPASLHAPPPLLRAALPPSPRKPVEAAAAAPPQATTSTAAATAAARAGLKTLVPFQPIRQPETLHKLPASRSYSPNDASLAFMRAVSRLDSEDAQSTSSDGDHNEMGGARVRPEGPHGRAPAPAPAPDRARAAPPTATTATSDDGSIHFEEEEGAGTETAKSLSVSPSPPPRVPAGAAVVKVMLGAAQHPPPLGFKALHPVPPPDKSVPRKLLMKAPPLSAAAAVPTSDTHATPTQPPARQGMALVLPTPGAGTSSSAAAGDAGTSTSPSASQQQQQPLPVPRRLSPNSSHNNSMAFTISAATATLGTMGVMGSGGAGASSAPHVASPAATTTATTTPLARLASQGHVRVLSTSQHNEDDPVYCTVSEMTMPNARSLRGRGISAGPSGLSIGQMQSGGGGGGGSAVPSSARLSVSPTVGNHRVMSHDLSFDESNPPSTQTAMKTAGAPSAPAAAAAPVLRDDVLSGSPPTTPPVSPKYARGGGGAYRDEDGRGGGAGPERQALPAGVARPSAVHRTADGRTTAGPGVGPTRPSAAFRPKRPFVFATPPASASAPAAPAATAAATVPIPAASASDSLPPQPAPPAAQQRRGGDRGQHPVVGAARGTGASSAASEDERHTQRPDTPTNSHAASGVGVSRRPSAASMAGVKAVMCSQSAADVAIKAATAHAAESATARRRSSRLEAGAEAAGGDENEVSMHSSRSLRSTRSSFASGLSRFSSMLKRRVSAVVRGGGSGVDVKKPRTKASTAAHDAGHEQQDGDGESTSALMPASSVARDSHSARSLNTTAQLQLQRTLPGPDTVDLYVDIPDRSTSNASVVPATRSAAAARGDAKGTLTAARSCSQPPKSTSTADGSIRFQTDVEAEDDDGDEDDDDELQFVVEESDTPPPVVAAVVPVVAAASAKAAATLPTPGTSSHDAGGTSNGNASISKPRGHRESKKSTKETSAAGQRADPLHGEGRSQHRRHRSSRHRHRRHKRREASVEEKAEGEDSSRTTATSRGSSIDSSDTTSVVSATTSQAERRRQRRRERERRRRQQQRQRGAPSPGKARPGREVSAASSAKRSSASPPPRHASAHSTPAKSSQLVTPRALFNASAPRRDGTAANTESARQRRQYRRALCATGGVSSAHSRLLLRRRQRQRRLYRANAWLAERDEHHSQDAEDSYDDSNSEGDGDDAAQRRGGKRVGARRGRSAAATSPPQPSLVAVLAARRRELRAKSRVPSAVDHFAVSWHMRQVMRRRLEQAHRRAAQAALARQQQRAAALKGLSEESAVHRAVAAAARRSASVPRLASQLPRAASAAASRARGAQHAAAVAHPSASPRRRSESRLDQYEAALTEELRALDAVVEQRRRRELWTAAGPAGAAAAAQVPAVSRDASRAPAARPPASSTAAGPLPSRRRSVTHDAATPPRDHGHAVDRGDSSPAPRTPRTWRSTAGRAAAAAVAAAAAADRGGERRRGRGVDKTAPTRLRGGVAATAALVKASGARPRAAAREATPHASVGRAATPTASGSVTTTTHEPTAEDTDGHTDAATQRSPPPDRRAAVAPHLTLEALQRKYELLLEELVLDAAAGPSTIAVEDRDASAGHTKGVSGAWAVSPGSISGGSSSSILRAAPAAATVADAVAQGTARCAVALRAEYYRTSATPAAAALPHATALSPSAAAAVTASYVQALRPSCVGCRPQELEDYMTLSLLSMLHGPVQHRISGGVAVPAPRRDRQARPSSSRGTLVQRHIREELYAPPPPRLRNRRQPNAQAHVAAGKDGSSGSASASTAAAEARTMDGGDGTPTGPRPRSPPSPQPRAGAPPQPFTPSPARVCAMLQARVVKAERGARHACALAEAVAAQALYRLYLVETVLALRAAAAAPAQHTADAAPRPRSVSEDRPRQPLQLRSAEPDAVDGGDAHAHHEPATPAVPHASSPQAAAAAPLSTRVREAASSAGAPPFAPVGRHARHDSVGSLSSSSGAWLVPASSVPSKQERRGVESHGGGSSGSSSGASAFTGDVAASSQPGSDLDWTSQQHSALASAASYGAVCANTASASVSAAAGVETAAGSPVRRRPTPPHLPLPVALPDEETLLLAAAKPAAAAAAAATTEDGSVTAMGSPLLLASAETTPSPSQAPDSFFNATRSRTSGSPGDGGGRAVTTGTDNEDDIDAAMLLRLTLSAVASPVEGQAAKAQAEGALAAMVRSVDLPPSARDSKDSLAASSDVVFVLENPSQESAPCGVAAVAAAGFAPPPAPSASNTSLALEIEDVDDAEVGAGHSDGKSEVEHAEMPVEVKAGAAAAAAAASKDLEAMHTARSSGSDTSTSAPPAPVEPTTPEAPQEWREAGAAAAASSSTELDAHTHAPQAPPSLTTPQHAQGLVDSARSTVPSSPIPQAVPSATQQAQQQQPAAGQQLAGTAGVQGSTSTVSLEMEDDNEAAAGLANGEDAGRAEADAGGVAHGDSVADVAGAGAAAASAATAAAAATNNGAALPDDGDASTSAQTVAASSSLPVPPAAVQVDTSAFTGAEREANAAPGGPLEFASTSSSTSSDHAEITSPMKKISASTTTTEATTPAPPPRPLAATGDMSDHLEPSSTTTAAGDEGTRPLSIDRGEHLVDSGSQESRSSSSGGGVVEGARDEYERGARADGQQQEPSEVEVQSAATPRRPAPPLPTSPSSSSSGSLESLIVHVTAAAAAPVDVEEVPEDARVGPDDAPVDSSLDAAESGVAAAVAQADATSARDEDAGAAATPPTAAVPEEVADALAVTPAGSADEATAQAGVRTAPSPSPPSAVADAVARGTAADTRRVRFSLPPDAAEDGAGGDDDNVSNSVGRAAESAVHDDGVRSSEPPATDSHAPPAPVRTHEGGVCAARADDEEKAEHPGRRSSTGDVAVDLLDRLTELDALLLYKFPTYFTTGTDEDGLPGAVMRRDERAAAASASYAQAQRWRQPSPPSSAGLATPVEAPRWTAKKRGGAPSSVSPPPRRAPHVHDPCGDDDDGQGDGHGERTSPAPPTTAATPAAAAAWRVDARWSVPIRNELTPPKLPAESLGTQLRRKYGIPQPRRASLLATPGPAAAMAVGGVRPPTRSSLADTSSVTAAVPVRAGVPSSTAGGHPAASRQTRTQAPLTADGSLYAAPQASRQRQGRTPPLQPAVGGALPHENSIRAVWTAQGDRGDHDGDGGFGGGVRLGRPRTLDVSAILAVPTPSVSSVATVPRSTSDSGSSPLGEPPRAQAADVTREGIAVPPLEQRSSAWF